MEKLHLNNNNYSDDLFAHLLRFTNKYVYLFTLNLIHVNTYLHIISFVNIAFKYAMLPASDSTWAYIINGYARFLKHSPKRDCNITRKADLQALIAITKIYTCICVHYQSEYMGIINTY